MDEKELYNDMLADAEFDVSFYTKALAKAKLRLQAMQDMKTDKAPLDIDALLKKRKYPEV